MTRSHLQSLHLDSTVTSRTTLLTGPEQTPTRQLTRGHPKDSRTRYLEGQHHLSAMPTALFRSGSRLARDAAQVNPLQSIYGGRPAVSPTAAPDFEHWERVHTLRVQETPKACSHSNRGSQLGFQGLFWRPPHVCTREVAGAVGRKERGARRKKEREWKYFYPERNK